MLGIVVGVALGASLVGATMSVAADEGEISTLGGGGLHDPTAQATQGDGGPAVAAWFTGLAAIDVEPTGGVLVADGTAQVRRIRADGILEVAAGTTQGFSGDGGPATAARLSTPSDLAVDPAGGFVVVDEGNHRVRKVWPDGTITTIAGNGNDTGTFLDGSLATAVPLVAGHVAFAPDGQLYLSTSSLLYRLGADGNLWAEGSSDPYLTDMAFDQSGTLFASIGGNRVARRDAPGVWTVVAGSSAPDASSADGIPATSARLPGVYSLAVAPGGDLVLADNTEGRVRRVHAGIISTVAGGGSAAEATGCMPATRASSVPASHVAVRSNGAIVVSVGFVVREIQVQGQTCPSITSVAPTRVLETRATEGQIGYQGPSPVSGQVVRVSFAASPLVPASAQAVALNVTITGARNDGFVTAWPCENELPRASNLNVSRGGTAANAAIVKLGTSRELCLYDQAGGDLLVDVTGYVGGTVPYQAVVPYRALDTRSDGPRFNYTGDKPAAGQTVRVTMSGFGYFANTVSPYATAVVLNVTATDATSDGYVTVWSCDGPRPTASNVIVARGGTVGRMVVVKLGLDTTKLNVSKQICLFTQSGTHLLVDVLGVFMPDAPYVGLTPDRLLETRGDAGQVGYAGARPTSGQVVGIDVVGRSGGAVPSDARAVVLSVTATNPVAAGYITVWPCGSTRPLASSLNLAGPGDTQSNAVVVGLGTGGTVCLFTQSGADLIVDLNGYFP